MFEVGDRVVCVNDSPLGGDPETPSGLHRGRAYTIVGIERWPSLAASGEFVDNLLSLQLAKLFNVYARDGGFDASRFRKLRDISQSLRELKELAINCPALEPVARAREGK